MVDAAKLRLLPPDDAQVLHALLFFGERERRLAAAAILRKRGIDRQLIYNLLAVQAAGKDEADASLVECGEQLLSLQYRSASSCDNANSAVRHGVCRRGGMNQLFANMLPSRTWT